MFDSILDNYKEDYALVQALAERLNYGQEWIQEVIERGRMVQQYREYYKGRHPVKLNDTMRAILTKRADSYWFGVNYCAVVIDEMRNRLEIDGISVLDDDDTQLWVDGLLDKGGFDAFQSDLHLAVLRDGDVFVMPQWDNNEKRIDLFLNYAFDGYVGVIPVYELDKLKMVIKVISVSEHGRLVVFYTADNVSMFRYFTGGEEESRIGFDPKPFSDFVNDVGKIPIIHFSNRRLQGESFGVSEIMNVLALQDALNSSIVTAMGASYLSGFPIGVWKSELNSPEPEKMAPGTQMTFRSNDPQLLREAGYSIVDTPEFTGNMNLITDLVSHIGNVSGTPISVQYEGRGSGEAMKQNQVKLLAKVRNAQIKLGASWESLIELCVETNSVYGDGGSVDDLFFITRWADKQIRNDLEVVDIWRVIYDVVAPVNIELATELFLQGTAEITNLSDSQIEGFDLAMDLEVMENVGASGAGTASGASGASGAGANADSRGSKGRTQGGANTRGDAKEGKRGTPNSSERLAGRGRRSKDSRGGRG